MIDLTRLNGKVFGLNPDLLHTTSENPDTTLVMVDGATHVVKETRAEVHARIAQYRASVIALARDMQPAAEPSTGPRSLSVVPSPGQAPQTPHERPSRPNPQPPRK